MRFVCGAALLVMLSGPAWADQTPVPPNTGEVADKKFWFVGAALNTAMLLDTKSTFDALRRCDRCYEANPYAAPFVNRGPAVAFTAGQAFDIGVMLVAAKMKSSDRPRVRTIWWLVPVAITSGHLIAYRHNLGVAR